MGKIFDWMKNAVSEDEATRAHIERLAAIREIENTLGYQLILNEYDRQITWAREELTHDLPYELTSQLRQYLKALGILRQFIALTEKNGKAAKESLDKQLLSQKPQSVEDYHDLVFNRQ